MLSPLTSAFTDGKSRSAIALALMKNGMYVSRTPWASSFWPHSFLSATIALMSASSKQWVCAAVCLARTMCSAMSLRTLENGTTSSRGPAAAGAERAARNAGGGPAVAGAAEGTPTAPDGGEPGAATGRWVRDWR